MIMPYIPTYDAFRSQYAPLVLAVIFVKEKHHVITKNFFTIISLQIFNLIAT